MTHQETLDIATRGRGTYEITREVQALVQRSDIGSGLCHVFVRHTSASLLLCENAAPQVRQNLEAFLGRLVPDGDPLFGHLEEGPDDMSAHVRSVLAGVDLTVPVSGARLALGIWQDIYLMSTAATRTAAAWWSRCRGSDPRGGIAIGP
jgi:secondary thiamine-phosphate synthase enzyme